MREFVVGRDAAPHARMTYPLKVATISVPSPRATTRGGHRMMARHGVDSAPPPAYRVRAAAVSLFGITMTHL